MEKHQFCYKYPHPAVTTDCVILAFDGKQLKLLLIERAREPHQGKWALPGGFLNIDEEAGQGALRELLEETGVGMAQVEQFGVFSTPDRDPRERVITIAHVALVSMQQVVAGDDAAKAQWFSPDALPQLAFDHALIIAQAFTWLRRLIEFEPIGLDAMPQQFHIGTLQLLYEQIMGTKLNGNHLAHSLLHHGIITPLSGCPTLFEFDRDRCRELKGNCTPLRACEAQ